MSAKRYWTCLGSHIELELTAEDARQGSHQGACDNDIADLRTVSYIAEQLAALDPDKVRAELDEYGAWNETELADHDANLSRALWIAACNIREELPT
jgi:hypothetical protein